MKDKKLLIYRIIYSIISLAILICTILLFSFIDYYIYSDNGKFPVFVIYSIILFVLAVGLTTLLIITKNYKNKIKYKLEEEKAYQIHCERMKIENEKFEQYKKEHQIEETPKSKYHIKTKTITNNEKYFLDIIKKHFGKDYDIRVQVPLSNIIEKEKDFEGQYQNELNRIIDIGIFDKDTSYPLLLIEINDSTHKRKERQIRDTKVKNICEQAGIKLIAFWTEYSNTEEYIFNRVNTNLRDSN